MLYEVITGFGLVGGDGGFRCVGVAARADHAAQHDGDAGVRIFVAKSGT